MTAPTTDTAVFDTLKATFGYTTFRPLQEEIVRSILAGQDVFVLMPTGGGKSLCYQLPALLKPGVTVVVSPLIALMKDQVDALQTLGVSATYINSSLNPSEVNRRQAMVARSTVKLVYVAPERLMHPGFLRLLAESQLAGFAIDEAHCISEWGHDFRPEYRALSRLRDLFPTVSFGAYTATATARVQADIRAQLRLGQAASFRGSFNRANLFYEVRPKRQQYEALVAYLRTRRGQSGIIYCFSRANTEDLARRLKADGFRATAYHAGLTGEERHHRQEAFVRDDIDIIIATIAFGMGIDKPDVRFVIHYDLPKSLEGYYQESGRAGRDRDPSDCILFFSAGDIMKLKFFLDDKASPQERQVGRWQLQQMANWAEGTTCRRQTLLGYFDEPFTGQEGPCCDICREPAETEDVTVAAQKFLSCVKRTGERFGAAHVVDVLRGSRNQKILQLGHERLSTYGIGRDVSVESWRHLSKELLRLGYIRQEGEDYPVLALTERARNVLFAGERVSITLPRTRQEREPGEAEQPHADLVERLRELRKRIADEKDLPPYAIFHDTVLRHLAAHLPADREQLLQIPGIGQSKALVFGDAFMREIAEYVRETGAQPSPIQAAPKRTKGSLGNAVLETLWLFGQGEDIEGIAAARGVKTRTVVGYLVRAMEGGEAVDIDRIVNPEKRQEIERVMHQLGYDMLAPVREALGEDYSYDELQIVRASLRQAVSMSYELSEPAPMS